MPDQSVGEVYIGIMCPVENRGGHYSESRAWPPWHAECRESLAGFCHAVLGPLQETARRAALIIPGTIVSAPPVGRSLV
jgi:hypothetical protein